MNHSILHDARLAQISTGAPYLTTSTCITIVAPVLLVVFASTLAYSREGEDERKPARLPGSSLLAIFPFFNRRFDFINSGFRLTGKNIFQFNLLRKTVVIVSGETARTEFFANKYFDLTEGVRILSGAIPIIKGVTSGSQTKRIATIHKRLQALQRNEPLSRLMPQMLDDARRMMASWGQSGQFDPFEKIYEVTFQTTIRSLSCCEIADDPVMVARLKKLYDKLENGTTPATILVPWIPTPAMIAKVWATKEIYDIVTGAIKRREESGIERDDTLQMLLEFKDEKLIVVGFIMGLLVAGARATGSTACWLLTFLGGHHDWRDKLREELEHLISIHTHPDDGDASLSKRLSAIPLETWESSTPVLDCLIRETLRLAQTHTAMRRNDGPDAYIDGKLVPAGAFAVYPFSDVHLDAEIYPEPYRFDPSRPLTTTPLGYIGWGGGQTTCPGQRLARVELKLITAMFVLGFDHEFVDMKGAPAPLPTPNWNEVLPPRGSCYLGYSRTKAAL